MLMYFDGVGKIIQMFRLQFDNRPFPSLLNFRCPHQRFKDISKGTILIIVIFNDVLRCVYFRSDRLTTIL